MASEKQDEKQVGRPQIIPAAKIRQAQQIPEPIMLPIRTTIIPGRFLTISQVRIAGP